MPPVPQGRSRSPASGAVPGLVVWLTGLVSSGKTTVAKTAARRLMELGHPVVVIDGDELRQGISAGLGFDRQGRRENVHRAAQLAAQHATNGEICLVALIAPYAADRAEARNCLEPGRFLEVYVNTPITVCEQRDPKGLYARARAGALSGLTGIAAPYEPPVQPELVLATHEQPLEACVERLVNVIIQRL